MKILLWIRNFLGFLLFMSPTFIGAISLGLFTMFLLAQIPLGSLPGDIGWIDKEGTPILRGLLIGIGVCFGYAITGFLYGQFLFYADKKTEEKKPLYMGNSEDHICGIHPIPYSVCVKQHRKPIVYQFEEPGIKIHESNGKD